ncbi:MAG: Na/Pi cotransporter family protein [Oscillospiraceae bacterium]|nr:Na/Pi cotransporter family protein [Oscillospiraceae bacterium]
MDLAHIISLIGGVAFFLFGMETMGNGLKSLAGNRMEGILFRLSSPAIKGFFLGILVTAVIQSSGATTVMVISFVSAGMMTLTQAIPIVLGTNIGTTMTGWILSISGSESVAGQLLSTEVLIAVFATIGALLYMFTSKNSTKSIGLVLLGLSTILLSMSLISDSVDPLKESEAFQNILFLFKNPVLGVLAGVFVAAVIQSCSAGVGILQALCTSVVIPYSVCLPLILGIKIGASSPVLIAMIGKNKNSKRTALVYLIANILTAVLVAIILVPINAITGGLSFMNESATTTGIALMNSAISIVGMVILLPMSKLIEKICYIVIKPDPSESEDTSEIDSLDENLLDYVPAAIEVSRKAALKMCDIARKNIFRAIRLITEYDKSKYQKVAEKESLCDKYEDKLGNYLVKIGKNVMDEKQQAISSELLSVIGDFERISDHAANIAENAEEIHDKKIVFSDEAAMELQTLTDAVSEIINLASSAFVERRRDLAVKVEPLEETIDEMSKVIKNNHIERVQSGACTIVTGFVYSDLLTNFERVADHCSNIALSVLHSYDLNAEGHTYVAQIPDSPEFKQNLDDYRKKYLFAVAKSK